MQRTIPALFEAALAQAADKTWLIAGDESYTYSQTYARIGAAAAWLADRGVRPGDRVMASAENLPAFVFAWFATVWLGAIHVAVNPNSPPAELDGIAGQVDPVVRLDGDSVGELLQAQPAEPPPCPAGEGDPAVLIPTSGTTGRSKLVTQTHRAYVMAGEGFPWWMELTAEDRLMTSLPLFHVNAPAYSMLGSVAARASLVLLPRFSASTFIESARRHGATEFNAIGAMLEMLMAQPERPDDADNPLRLAYSGPSPPRERHLEIEQRFGFRLVCGYALSESPYGTFWRHGTRPYGTLGWPRQHPTLGHVNDHRVVDGELQLRNPAVMKGYWNMPEETAEVLLEDGWLKTGDLVRENPDGSLTFLGRRKEVIRRRGENVAPAEIEEALASHPDVSEVAVVGVPSELSEEEIKAFVVVAGGADLAAVRSHAAEQLTRFKVPRYVEAVSELPHTPTGRIAKHRLPRERNDTEVDFA
jgi:carnitine-CoA ligase